MTREEAKQLLPIIKAFSEGKVIEARTRPDVLNNPAIPNEWTELKELEYWGNTEYRIKPQPKYRPFNSAEECWQEMQKHQPFGWIRWKKEPRNYQSLVLVEKGGVGCVIDEISMKFKESLDILTFADGSVFGVKEEEV